MVKDANCHIIIGQKRYIKTLNRLQWECDALNTFLCIDSHRVLDEDEKEENQLMSRNLWEYIGESATDAIGGGGWTSSYTGQPIPKIEMDEYADNIFFKLKPLLHNEMKVLEIGAASGISMFQIAPHVASYYGTDLSQVIIDKNRQRADMEGHQNIKLKRLPAHDIDQLQETGFHLVILNSVIQCFNGHNYLRKTIKKILALMKPNSYLFLGDLMDQDLKRLLISELTHFSESHQNKDYQTKTDLTQELFISRRFLEDLLWEFPAIKSVEFSKKHYTIENELTKFRYDALFQIDKESHLHPEDIPAATATNRTRHKRQHDRIQLEKYDSTNPNIAISPGHLAYILYTSGSSGLPKGVMINHQSIVNLIYSHREVFSGDEKSRFSQVAGAAFDAMGFEIWPALTSGAALAIADDRTRIDPRAMQHWLIERQITFSFQPTMMAQQLLMLDWAETPISLKKLCAAGEQLTVYPHRKYPFTFYNLYGPTEDTVWTTWTEVPMKPYTNSGSPSIGKPVINKQVYILSHSLQLQPIGTTGELCISGDGLARGYLNQPELTEQKFNLNPFHSERMDSSSADQKYIYRTGDLARWLPDGNIEFLGRIDSQVKIRGFRIELGEIENQLLNIPNIHEAVVTNRTDKTGDSYLAAYIVSPAAIDIREIKNNLAKRLPSYMLPSSISIIDEIPITTNGKIDKQNLPEPETESSNDFLQPQNETQRLLLGIWSEVLSIPVQQIGIQTNFFDIGGNSLKIMRVSAKLNEIFTDNIPIARMFQYPTIQSFAKYLNPYSMHVAIQDREESKAKAKKRSKLNDRKKRIRRAGNQRA
jgi:amino acid adenylation domain-containing protein